MRFLVVLASDHAGFELKRSLSKALRTRGYSTRDVGAFNSRPSDYPDYAEKLALKILSSPSGVRARGILICGSGVGASIAANKIPGIRAGLCHDSYSAHQGVEHDDMNVLVLGARVVGEELAEELAHRFLQARFSREPRHHRRVGKMRALESRYCVFTRSRSSQEKSL